MSDHPSPYRLEALMVGEADPEAQAHLDGCDGCQAYIEGLRADRSAMLNAEPAAAFLARPEIAAALDGVSSAQRSPSRGWLRWLVPVALVGAAAVIFLIGAPTVEGPGARDEIILKGAEISVEIVRRRIVSDGTAQQTRHTNEVPVLAGDALRVRLRLARRTRLTIAIIADGEGDWMNLASAQWFEPGEQFVPGEALAIEAGPTTGHMIVGAPEAVAAAKKGDETAPVTRVRIRAEATP